MDDKLYSMTLIVAVFNKDTVIIASDRLVTVELNGNREPDEVFDKITQSNPSTAILFTGRITGNTITFLKTFAYSNRLERNVTILRDKLLQQIAQQPLTLLPTERFQVCLAGFTDKVPTLKIVTAQYGKEVVSEMSEKNYYVGGFTHPAQRALALLKGKGIENHLSKNQLRKAVKETITQCIDEYKDDTNGEKLGGSPDIRVLSLS